MTDRDDELIPGQDRFFEFSDDNFERVRRLIYGHAGISLAPGKRDMVYSRLSRRLRALNLTRFDDYLALLSDDSSPEWQAFTNALTTNLTAFFRESHHFPILAEHLRSHYKGTPLVVWCSASSTGEEPYSIAMTACEAFDSLKPPVRVLASDIDTQVLATAAQGVYAESRLEHVSMAQRKRFFLRGSGRHAGYVKVRTELTEMISFRQINLLEAKWPIRGPFDAIFCRNVMIYFDKPTQNAILERFRPLMTPDGLLFAGHSESFPRVQHLFELQGKTVYRPAQRMAAVGNSR